jgi:hypothetical protein
VGIRDRPGLEIDPRPGARALLGRLSEGKKLKWPKEVTAVTDNSIECTKRKETFAR